MVNFKWKTVVVQYTWFFFILYFVFATQCSYSIYFFFFFIAILIEADDDYSDGSQEPISGRYILQRSGRQNEQSLSSTKGSSNASAFLDVFSFLDDENSSGDSDEEEDYKQVLGNYFYIL